MTIIEQLQWRYATKKFDTTKEVSESKLQIIKEAFNLTAVSYGLQTLKLVVVKDRELRKSLVDIAFDQPQVVDASHLLVLCIQSTIDDEDIEMHFKNIKAIRNTPDKILNPFKEQLKSTLAEMLETKKTEWASRQAYIALGNLMTVCAVEKIDCCPMEGFNPEALDKALNLQQFNLKSVLLLPIGYRADDDIFANFIKVRKPLKETVIEL